MENTMRIILISAIILSSSIIANIIFIYIYVKNKNKIDLTLSVQKNHLDELSKLSKCRNKLTKVLSLLGGQCDNNYLKDAISEMSEFSSTDNDDCDALSRNAIINGIKLLKHKYFQLLIDRITTSPKSPSTLDTILKFDLSLLNPSGRDFLKNFEDDICAVFNTKINSLLAYSDLEYLPEYVGENNNGWQIPAQSMRYLTNKANESTFAEYESFNQEIICIDSYQGKIDELQKAVPLLERELIGMECRKEIGTKIIFEIKSIRDDFNMKNDSHVKLASTLIDIQTQIENIIDDFEQKAGIDHAIKVGMNMVEKQKSTSDDAGYNLAGRT